MGRTRRDLGDLAAELIGIEGTVETLSLIVKPDEERLAGDSLPSQATLEGAFYAIARALERIADDLNAMEAVELSKANA